MPNPCDLAVAAAFLHALGGNGPFTFQTFDDSKGKRPELAHIIHGSLAGCAKTLADLNAAGAGVFVTVNVTDGRGRSAANVTDLRALFVDSDHGCLPSDLPGANIRVRTKAGEHAYWLLSPDEPRSDFGAAQKRLITALGTDPAIHDLPRVMRIPGFWHMKDPASPFMVDLWLADDQARRTIPEVLAMFPALDAAEAKAARDTAAQPARRTKADRFALMLADLAVTRVNRNEHLYRAATLAGDLVATGEMSETDAVTSLWKSAEACGLVAEEHDKTKATISRALGKDREDDKLQRNAQGDVKGTLGNMLHILATHRLWQGVLGYDERRESPYVVAPPPWDDEIEGADASLPRKITVADAGRLAAWFSWRYRSDAKVSVCRDALGIAAERHPFDKHRDYLDSVRGTWDGTDRIATWLITYAGADDTRYTRAVSGRWLISAVARTMVPGCKVDTMLILQGPQGVGKSTLLRTVAGPEAFSDGMPPIDTKDAKIHVHGPAIIEIPELSALTGRRGEAVKAFLSAQEDTFRRPYGAGETTSLRRAVFAGTSNADEILDDESGGRRFWPVQCQGAIDVAGVEAVRDQLWAEALYLFETGEQWWLTDDEVALAAVVQESVYEEDAIEDAIREALEHGKTAFGFDSEPIPAGCIEVTIGQILDCVCGDSRERKQMAQKRITKALRHLGWHPFRLGGGGKRVWRP